jgi:hypothetical protein
MLGRVRPGERRPVDPRAELGQHRGQQGEGRGEDEEDRDHDPERDRAEGRAGDEHHRRQRDDHGQAGEEDRLAGGVHRPRHRLARRQALAEERAAEPHHHEQGVVDAERKGEHQREVHRPDRDRREQGAEIEDTGGEDEADDRQHQRQAGGDQRAEGEDEDRQRHRPGEELGLQHRLFVGLVEVGPHAGGAGEAGFDPGGGDAGQLTLELARGGDHPVRVLGRRGADHGGVAVAGDRDAGLGRDDFADRRVGGERALDAAKRALEGGALDREPLRVDGDLQTVGAGTGEGRVDLPADGDRLRAGRFPAGAGERGLDPGGEEAEADGGRGPDEEDGAAVGGGEPAEAPDRSEWRGRYGVSSHNSSLQPVNKLTT